MRSTWFVRISIFLSVASFALVARAREPKPYQSGKLLQMNAVHCGTAQKSDTSPLGELIGTDDRNTKSQDLLCQEYVLETDTVVYRIRPKEEKHPALLPPGSSAQFRIEKGRLFMRVEGLDDKDHEYSVVSMMPRGSAQTDTAQSQASLPGQAR